MEGDARILLQVISMSTSLVTQMLHIQLLIAPYLSLYEGFPSLSQPLMTAPACIFSRRVSAGAVDSRRYEAGSINPVLHASSSFLDCVRQRLPNREISEIFRNTLLEADA